MRNKVTKERLLKFDFRFVNHVTRDLYEIVDAREWAKKVNATKPYFVGDSIAFWCDECDDHAFVINMEDVLLI